MNQPDSPSITGRIIAEPQSLPADRTPLILRWGCSAIAAKLLVAEAGAPEKLISHGKHGSILSIYQAGAAGQCKPEIFVASIDPSYRARGSKFSVSTSVTIQDSNGVGIQGARVKIEATFPDGEVLSFPVTTDPTGQATLTFSTTASGLYTFTVRKVTQPTTQPTRDYEASLNIETSDTLLIP